MRRCTKCNVSKDLSEFSLDIRYREGRRRWCRECVNTYQRELKKTKQYDKAYRQRVRNSHTQCYFCANSDGRALEFHHIKPKGYSAQSHKERNKCISLCANCHSILHYESRLRHNAV